MSVLFSPAVRLARARVCLVAPSGLEPATWQDWCVQAVRGGAGMIVIDGHGRPVGLTDDLARRARQVVGNVLVGVAEPVDQAVRADVIQLTHSNHRPAWPGRLAGCAADSPDQAVAALAAGCDYVVVDWRVPGLVAGMGQLQTSHPGMVWFVSGCDSLADLEQATRLGARRVWMRTDDGLAVGDCSDRLRQVWRADPAMSGLAQVRERF